MRWPLKLRLRLRSIFLRDRVEGELEREMQFHLEQQIQENVDSGMSPENARLAALRAMGGLEQRKEECRDMRRVHVFANLAQDIRIGARTLLKSPLFTIFASAVLAIGIGANVTVFFYVNALLFKPFSAPQPGSLVKVYGEEGGATTLGPVDESTYREYRDRSAAFENLGAFWAGPTFPLRIDGPGERPVAIVPTTTVSGSLLRALRIAALSGRNIDVSDEGPGAARVAVLNEAAARQYFPGGAVGRAIFLNQDAFTIIGVAPPAFDDVLSIFPTSPSPRIFLPDQHPVNNLFHRVSVIGRLRPEVTRQQAQADLARVSAQLTAEKKANVSVSVERADRPPSFLWTALASIAALFLVGVFVILLIACDDIAIMLLARIAARRHEMGIRMALGAARGQLISQLVAENVLLAVLGGIGATIFTLLSARLIDNFGLPLPESSRIHFDWHVLLFTIAISLATTLFFGLRPALDCVKKDIAVSLTPGASPVSPGLARVRTNLIITQITVCTALLITAAAVMRSSASIRVTGRGFTAAHVLLSRVNFADTAYKTPEQLAFYRLLLDRLHDTPGIEAACISESIPVQTAGYGRPMSGDAIHAETNTYRNVFVNAVSPGHFATLSIPIIAGRDFLPDDDSQASSVVIVSRSLAQALWPNENPVGRRVVFRDSSSAEVVGVADDIQYRLVNPVPALILYRPLRGLSPLYQGGDPPVPPDILMIRTAGAPAAAETAIRAAVADIDPTLLVFDQRPLDEQLELIVRPFRIFSYLMGAPGAFALLLGIIGTYGTMATLVTQRRREIGIRVALGAHPSAAARLVVRDGVTAVAIGGLMGIFGAYLIALWLIHNFPELNGQHSFVDPVAFLGMAAIVITTALAACYIPARRASRVDPMIVLREE